MLQWKVLVVDETSRKILVNSVKEDDVLNHNVTSTRPPSFDEAGIRTKIAQISSKSSIVAHQIRTWTRCTFCRRSRILSTV